MFPMPLLLAWMLPDTTPCLLDPLLFWPPLFELELLLPLLFPPLPSLSSSPPLEPSLLESFPLLLPEDPPLLPPPLSPPDLAFFPLSLPPPLLFEPMLELILFMLGAGDGAGAGGGAGAGLPNRPLLKLFPTTLLAALTPPRPLLLTWTLPLTMFCLLLVCCCMLLGEEEEDSEEDCWLMEDIRLLPPPSALFIFPFDFTPLAWERLDWDIPLAELPSITKEIKLNSNSRTFNLY